MIIEIAKVLNECCGFYDEKGVFLRNKCNSHDCEYWCDTNYVCCSYNDKQATALYNANYRKIPKGAVVLTKEEYEQLAIEYKRWEKLAIEDMITQVRKETVREILKELIKNCQYTFNSVGKPIIALSGDFALNTSKRYDVDIEE